MFIGRIAVSEEIFDVVNEQDEVIGRASRGEIHRLALRHRAVHLLAFNSSGELFLQKRSMKKDCDPGTWDSSASGHVDGGESYDEAVRREAMEELGHVLGSTPETLFTIEACEETGWEFARVYRCRAEGPFTLQAEEIDEGRWLAPKAIEEWITTSPNDFASSFRLIWERLRVTLD